jgi:transaldolase
MKNLLEQLKAMTAIVVDTGDIDAIRHHRSEDATTNPVELHLKETHHKQ